MNKLLSFTGGKPDFNIDDMLWNDESTQLALQNTFKSFGDNYIVQGCELTGSTIAAGYIMLDSELIRVESHTKTNTHFVKVTTYDSGGDVTFNNGTARQTWQKNRATVTAASGNLEYVTPEWTALSLINGFTGSAKVRIDRFGYLEIFGYNLVAPNPVTNVAFAVLPTAFRIDYSFTYGLYSTPATLDSIISYSGLTPFELKSTQASLSIRDFYIRTPLSKP